MALITLKEYAEQNHVTYEAVRKQVKRYEEALGDHIIKDGRQQFLDDYAVAFLDEHRAKNPVVIYQASKDEEIERLRAENENLLRNIAALSAWKADNAMAIAAATQTQLLLENTRSELDATKQEVAVQTEAAAKANQRAQEAEERATNLQEQLDSEREAKDQIIATQAAEIKAIQDDAQQATQRADDAESQVQRLKNRKWFERLLRKGE